MSASQQNPAPSDQEWLKPVASAKPASLGERINWSQIPFTRASYGTLPDSIPDMKRLTGVDLQVASDPSSPSHELLLQRFQVIVMQNPIPDVATELDALLRKHAIIYGMDPYMKAAASFFVGQEGWPFLRISTESLAKIHGRAEVAGFMLVIAHEFVHYKQWRDSTDPELRATFRYDAKEKFHLGMCKHLWQFERDAYKQTNCEWGNRFGLNWTTSGDPRADYCARINSAAAFDQAFFYNQVEDGSETSQRCAETWWDLAGGPRKK